MNMFQSRRGVTPLVATLLLIVFAIALGVLTMSVGGSYLQEKNVPLEIAGCAVVPASESAQGVEFMLPSITIYGSQGSMKKSAQCTVVGVFGLGTVSKAAVNQ